MHQAMEAHRRVINQLGDVHRAAGDGDLRVLKATLDADPDAARARTGNCPDGLLPLHVAAKHGRADAAKMLLDVYPEAARLEGDLIGFYPLEFAVEGSIRRALNPNLDRTLPTPDFVGTAKVLLDAYPEAGENVHQMFQPVPELQVMIALSQVGHTPSRPWTTVTPRALRDAAERYDGGLPGWVLLAHLSRVRDVVLVVRRCGLPAHLAPVIAGALYALELW